MTTTIQRAMELARSGSIASLDELRARLGAEGHFTRLLADPHLASQLVAAIASAHRGGKPPAR